MRLTAFLTAMRAHRWRFSSLRTALGESLASPSSRFVGVPKGVELTEWRTSRDGTSSEARGRGVGRALVAAAEEWGRGQGCTEFASDAQEDDEASAAAHRAVGFSEVGLVRCFRKDL